MMRFFHHRHRGHWEQREVIVDPWTGYPLEVPKPQHRHRIGFWRRLLLAIGIMSAVGMSHPPPPRPPTPILTVFVATLSTASTSQVSFQIQRQMQSGGWEDVTNVTALPVPVLLGTTGDRYRARQQSGTNFSEWTTQP